MQDTPKFGVHLPVMGFWGQEPTFHQIIASAQKAEDLDFDSLSINDHIVFNTSWLDALGTLSAAATHTKRIRVATSVLNIVVRHPVICAKAFTAADVLSSGRLIAGVGPGSHKGDYEACGISFDERWSRFDEALQVLTLLLDTQSADAKDYDGKYYRFKNILLEPRPLQSPHVPIHIASWGSDIGLRRVARYGDGWMASAYNITPDRFKEKWKLILSYRKELGKDTEYFENSIMTMFGYIDEDEERVNKMLNDVLAPSLGRSPEDLKELLLFGSADRCLKKVRSLVEQGVQRIHFWPVGDYLQQIEIFRREIASSLL
jgi:alkanesulfonate monooxygenase SsuD/methylene tetrahydromethanopterin reductase-like flavin-dependent oxidoreductase (luciferase family)